ncbi:MAG: efflux RND transporter periplasmic adaptor subunit [Kiloniellaceae bacterium]
MNDQSPPKSGPADIADILGLERTADDRRRRRRLAAAAVVVVLAAVAAVYLWQAAGSGDGLRYLTAPVERGALIVTVTATGAVAPTNKVEVSSELSGIIRTVMVDYNSRVEVGQVLAELDTDKLEANVASARARLAAAKARVKEAEATAAETKLEYDRKRTLVARNVTSATELDAAKASYERALASVESAKADVAAAEADLRVNETDLAKSCICSPIDGIVLSRDVEPGQTVASTLQAPVLFTIAEDLTKMEVQVDVDEADVGKVREGQQATFTVDAYPERSFAATIRELRFGSEVVQGVVTYKAVLTTDNSELLLRPGMTATAEIVVEELADAISVPNAALRFSPPAAQEDERSFLQKLIPGRPRLRAPSENRAAGAERRLWILADGQPQAVTVTVGSSDGSRTQIVAGDLQPGQSVIVDSLSAGS